MSVQLGRLPAQKTAVLTLLAHSLVRHVKTDTLREARESVSVSDLGPN